MAANPTTSGRKPAAASANGPVPHDPRLEAAFLGVLLYRPDALPAIAGVDPDLDFYVPAHRLVALALLELHQSGQRRADEITITATLRRLQLDGRLEDGQLGCLLNDAMASAPPGGDPTIYADLLRDLRWRREQVASAYELLEAARTGQPTDGPLDRLIASRAQRAEKRSSQSIAGGRFVLDAPARVQPVWGQDDEVLWPEGEPLMINGPTGVGKTTLGQQVLLGRVGLRLEVLGRPVVPEQRRVLYVAADRPAQAARSLARMVTEIDREVLDQRLTVWRGPLPFDVSKAPERLAAFAGEFDAGTVVIDSLKDVIAKASDEEAANRANSAFQGCVAQGIELMILHHQRKAQADNKKPTTIADVYGSTWIAAGMGSVLLLWGQPGDALVELSHLKQPSEPVGPWKLLHDHDIGVTAIQDAVDLLALVRTSNGLVAEGAARALFDTDKPSRNEVEKARRQLDKLVAKGLAHPEKGGRSAVDARQLPTRYFAIAREER